MEDVLQRRAATASLCAAMGAVRLGGIGEDSAEARLVCEIDRAVEEARLRCAEEWRLQDERECGCLGPVPELDDLGAVVAVELGVKLEVFRSRFEARISNMEQALRGANADHEARRQSTETQLDELRTNRSRLQVCEDRDRHDAGSGGSTTNQALQASVDARQAVAALSARSGDINDTAPRSVAEAEMLIRKQLDSMSSDLQVARQRAADQGPDALGEERGLQEASTGATTSPVATTGRTLVSEQPRVQEPSPRVCDVVVFKRLEDVRAGLDALRKSLHQLTCGHNSDGVEIRAELARQSTELCELRHCLDDLCTKGCVSVSCASSRTAPLVQGQVLQGNVMLSRSGSVQVLPPSSNCRRFQSNALPVGVGSDARRVPEFRTSALNINAATPGTAASPAPRGLSHVVGRCLPSSRTASRSDSTTPLVGKSVDASPGIASTPVQPGLQSPRHFSGEQQAFCPAAPPRLQQDPQYRSLASPHRLPAKPQLTISAALTQTQLAVGAAPPRASCGRASSPGCLSPARPLQGIESMRSPPMLQAQPLPRSPLVPHAWAFNANTSSRKSLGPAPPAPKAAAWQPSQGHGVVASLDLRNVSRSPPVLSLSREARPVVVPDDRH